MSSGEFNRASRVLLFSQLELIPPNKRTNLLILDEIEGHLDEAGMTAFCEIVLPKLKETFPDKTIVVISHLGSLAQAGVLDHIWLAERRDRKTTLTVYPDYKRKIV
jgi:DNA repair exonuclease SbcCD ATPase subunit